MLAWRVVVISKPASLRVDTSQLIVAQEKEVSLPLEDLSAVVLESPMVTLSSALLARMAQQDILLLVCDEKHLPCLIALPCAGHSRLAKMQRLQLETTLPFRKRCWQTVVHQRLRIRLPACRSLRKMALLTYARCCRKSQAATAIISRRARRKSIPPPFWCALHKRYTNWYQFSPELWVCHHARCSGACTGRAWLAQFPGNPPLQANSIRSIWPMIFWNRSARWSIFVFRGWNLTMNWKKPTTNADSLLGCDVLIDEQRQPAVALDRNNGVSFITAIREKDPGQLALPMLLPIARHAYE